MSKRPEVSDLIMNPLFNQAGQPFDPELARERAKHVANMLKAHPPIDTNVPQVIGAGIAAALPKNSR